MKKFKESDIFVNRIRAYPKVKFVGHSGSIYIDNEVKEKLQLNDFLPEPPPPPPPPPPTEASTLFVTSFTVYLKSGAGYLEPEFDIYPLDFSGAPSVAYVGIDWNASLFPDVQVIFRREDSVSSNTATLFVSGVSGYYDLPVGGSLTFLSNGTTWILQ